MPDPLVARLRAAGCVFAEEEAALLREAAGPDADARLERLVARRVAGEPLEHVLGWVAFAGRRWAVAPGVFVPRQRSELLVEAAVRVVRHDDGGDARVDPGWGDGGPGDGGPGDGGPGDATVTVVDLCCGVGALGGAVTIALREAGRAVTLHAADVDPAASACAARNLADLGAAVHTGDLDAPLPPTLRGRVDLLLCHAPYVPTAAIALLPPEAREHEPVRALDGGADGLAVLRRVIAAAPTWLAHDGALLFELGDGRQLTAARALLAQAGLRAQVHEDDETAAMVVVATRAPAG
ncbi:release factor glutamine methyltransferase [Xylanimonas ulmi]|uniref:Release factor glutamine methyltransferase n=1 Tax=Xylanimonas ulmi TaxID=228973 RepID=A0A4Q7M0L9_9MICO|nr:release factor glutamine methyltransferase [Xylanibacterium ulmi]